MAEIELKFTLSPKQLKRTLRQLSRCDGAGAPAIKELDAFYFDTPQCDLHKAGLTLRVRSENGTFVQALKCEGDRGGATLRRGELEDEVHKPVPDLSVGEGGRAVRDVLGKHPDLRPLFRIRVNRTTVEIRKKSGGCVEAALDLGEIETILVTNANLRWSI
jgi:triphosphatase